MNTLTAKHAAAAWNLKNLPSASRLLNRRPSPSLKPARLSRQLRCETSKSLSHRRGIVALSLVAVGAMGLISLYQMGVFRHLPHPALPGLDSDKVDASAEAYKRLATPDGTLGTASYSATLVLAAMGGRDRARERPLIPLALAAKILFDSLQAVRMIRVQWTHCRAFCLYGLAAAAATFATLPLALGETRQAWQRLTGGPRR